MTAPAPTRAEEGREIIAELERELGVTGTANVFRKALAIAKEAAAIARVRQETYAADPLVERLRSWGENDADPDFFTGDLLSGVLMDCGMGSEAIVAANLCAAQAEAEVARLTQERDEALCLAEGPSSLLDLARGSVSRGMELHAAEAEVARLRERVATLEAALRPFARSGELFGPRHPDDYDQAIYTPAAGQEYSLCGDHLRAARTALEAPHADN